MSQRGLAKELLEDLTADAMALSRTLHQLERGERTHARTLLRAVWSFCEAQEHNWDEGLRYARALDALIRPLDPAFSARIWTRLHQHWPLRLPCLEDRSVAPAAEAAAAFYEVRQARIDWIWDTMNDRAAGASEPITQANIPPLDLPVVDKGGRQ